MANYNSYQSDIIYVNGVKMTMKEYRKALKEKSDSTTKRKKKTKKTQIQETPSYVKALVRNAGPIKSLAAYYDNGYRQWGIIARTIMETDGIYQPFLSFRSKTYDMSNIINDICMTGKHDERAIYAYIQKLSWKLDDIKKDMNNLREGVDRSGVLERYKDKECINGTGRRLGLSILMDRTFESISKLDKVISELQEIAEKGVDSLAYIDSSKNRTFRRHI